MPTKSVYQETTKRQPAIKLARFFQEDLFITLYTKKNFLCCSGFFDGLDYILGRESKSVLSFSLSCQVLDIQRYEL